MCASISVQIAQFYIIRMNIRKNSTFSNLKSMQASAYGMQKISLKRTWANKTTKREKEWSRRIEEKKTNKNEEKEKEMHTQKNWAWVNRDLAQQLYGDDHIYAVHTLAGCVFFLAHTQIPHLKCNTIITWARMRFLRLRIVVIVFIFGFGFGFVFAFIFVCLCLCLDVHVHSN